MVRLALEPPIENPMQAMTAQRQSAAGETSNPAAFVSLSRRLANDSSDNRCRAFMAMAFIELNNRFLQEQHLRVLEICGELLIRIQHIRVGRAAGMVFFLHLGLSEAERLEYQDAARF